MHTLAIGEVGLRQPQRTENGVTLTDISIFGVRDGREDTTSPRRIRNADAQKLDATRAVGEKEHGARAKLAIGTGIRSRTMFTQRVTELALPGTPQSHHHQVLTVHTPVV